MKNEANALGLFIKYVLIPTKVGLLYTAYVFYGLLLRIAISFYSLTYDAYLADNLI